MTLNASTGEITASFERKTTVGLKKAQADQLFSALGEERSNKLKKKKELNGISVDVEPIGNA